MGGEREADGWLRSSSNNNNLYKPGVPGVENLSSERWVENLFRTGGPPEP